jgi:phage baseplate assembly protein W
MAVYDAQLNNDARATRQYTDLDLFFGRKTSDNDVRKVTDAQAVKRSIRNLVQLNTYEKPFHPEISGGVRELLFEPMSPIIAVVIARKIEDVITNFEPRARLVSVRSIPDLDRNAYEVSVEFYIVNAPTELVDFSIMLERLR